MATLRAVIFIMCDGSFSIYRAALLPARPRAPTHGAAPRSDRNRYLPLRANPGVPTGRPHLLFMRNSLQRCVSATDDKCADPRIALAPHREGSLGEIVPVSPDL